MFRKRVWEDTWVFRFNVWLLCRMSLFHRCVTGSSKPRVPKRARFSHISKTLSRSWTTNGVKRHLWNSQSLLCRSLARSNECGTVFMNCGRPSRLTWLILMVVILNFVLRFLLFLLFSNNRKDLKCRIARSRLSPNDGRFWLLNSVKRLILLICIL